MASAQTYMFSKLKNTLGVCKVMDKGHEIINFNNWTSTY